MAYGFQTSQGSLYVLDPKGRTARYKLSAGTGQGVWQDWAHCVFISENSGNAHVMGPLDICMPQQRLDLFYASHSDPLARPLPFRDNKPLARPKDCDRVVVLVSDEESGKALRKIGASMHPGIGLSPIEKANGDARDFHMGHQVTKVFNTVVELRDAFIAAGAKRILLPRLYKDELAKNDATGKPAEAVEHERTRTKVIEEEKPWWKLSEEKVAAEARATRSAGPDRHKGRSYDYSRSR